jgi:hypothetical protein
MKISESKTWSLLIVFILSIQFIVAQDKKIGFIGGVNYSSLYGDFRKNGAFPPKYRISFHVGLTSEFQLSDRVNFSPRLIFSSQGYRQKGDSSDFRNFDPEFSSFNFKNNNQLNYINVPLIFNFSFDSKIGLNFGPQFGVLLNSVANSKVTNEDGSVEEDKFTTSGDFKLDYGGIIGVSYRISNDIFIDINYYRGFSNISRGGIGDIKNNNSVFQLSFGYYIF